LVLTALLPSCDLPPRVALIDHHRQQAKKNPA
jgi:hypothetical protein